MIHFDPHWTYRGFRALLLENRYLRAVVLPELGAKIWSLVDKTADREVLWHNPRVPPRPTIYGAAYDDWFCGGWDELFPNDAPASISGDAYPDHGELWSMPYDWQADVDTHEVRLHLSRSGVVTPTFVEKSITLRADEPMCGYATGFVMMDMRRSTSCSNSIPRWQFLPPAGSIFRRAP